MATRTLTVKVVGDEADLLRAFKKSSRAADKFNRDMARTGVVTKQANAGFKGLAGGYIGATTAALALGGAVKASFSELFEAQKVTAQTSAVLESTGGVANVTADQIESLAQELLNLSGVDDEVIKSGENLLLTFTNVRNEAGKGNDIFNQATKAALDMSVAMGTDLNSAVLRIGKALNDPIRGITALRRVGVHFTDAQTKQIKALVASGRELEAQKIILRELQTEFGGSARAAGDTLPGQLNKARESARNLGATVAAITVPALTDMADSLNDLLSAAQNIRNPRKGLPSLRDFFKGIGQNVPKGAEALPTVGPFLGALQAAFHKSGEKSADEFKDGFQKQLLAQQIKLPPINTAGAGGIVQFFRGELRREAVRAENRAILNNRIFDNRVGRQLSRLQDKGPRQQLARLREIAQEIRARIKVTQDLERRLNLEDQLLSVLRLQRDVQKQIADNIRDANRALKERADAIKSAVIDRLQRRQTDILNKRALADAQEQLRIARRIGGPKGIRDALRAVQDARFDILAAQVENAPASLRGGKFALGNIITINVNGVTDPDAVARKVVAVLQKRGRRTTTQTRGANAGH